jgi:hypothetical protein
MSVEWSDHNCQILRDLYPSGGAAAVIAQIPGATKHAVYTKAREMEVFYAPTTGGRFGCVTGMTPEALERRRQRMSEAAYRREYAKKQELPPMPDAIIWSEDMDDAIRVMRAAGSGWDAIEKRVGVSRWAVIERAKVIGAYTSVPGAGKPARIDPSVLAAMITRTKRKTVEAPVKLVWNPRPIPPASDCQWPLNDGRPWLFCGQASAEGRSYCAGHQALACGRVEAPMAAE